MTVVADTGALYALMDVDDAWHSRVLTWWSANRKRIVVPVTVLPELTCLLQTRISANAELAFMRSVENGEFNIEPLEPEDVPRSSDLMERYADFPLGFVDASIVAVAERLETRELVTTDRRHFTAVRQQRSTSLVPSLILRASYHLTSPTVRSERG
jgi:predicted nucleic acid-binding protein